MAKAQSLRIPVPTPPQYDVAEANRLVDQAFESQGWLLPGEDGLEHDLDKLRHAMFLSFTTNHIVTATAAGIKKKQFDELVSNIAVTKYGLYIEIFPEGPGAQGPPKTEEEQAAKDFLAKYIWGQCTPTNRRAWLQHNLAQSQLVVLEIPKVYSDDPRVPPEPGRYVTNVEHAMLDFLEHKVLEDVRKKIDEADEWLATFYRRNPGMALTASRKARAALKQAVEKAVHANPTHVRESLALEASTSEDSSTEE